MRDPVSDRGPMVPFPLCPLLSRLDEVERLAQVMTQGILPFLGCLSVVREARSTGSLTSSSYLKGDVLTRCRNTCQSLACVHPNWIGGKVQTGK